MAEQGHYQEAMWNKIQQINKYNKYFMANKKQQSEIFLQESKR